MLEKPKLFLTAKEFWLTMALLSVLILVRLGFLYEEYSTFKIKPFYYTHVEVLKQYQKSKDNKNYTILRVHSSALNLDFFTRTYSQKNLLNKQVRLKLFPNESMKFFEYLGTSFINSRINRVEEKPLTFKFSLLAFIDRQHDDSIISSFYQAIFFATPLQKELREQVSKLGVSHLIALSGFHLAILSGVLFFLIRPFYGAVQQRYFPYRFDLIDIGLMVLAVLGVYIWFMDAPASLLRSYSMMVMGWFLLVMGVELLSFAFLATMVMFLLLIFPKMLVSLAFWFSVLGVFYIFLLLQRFHRLNGYLMTLIISFGIFVLMLPIVHVIFPITSMLQLYSPLLSLLFSPFYPLSMLLHLIGIGGLLDEWLLTLFKLEGESREILLFWWYGIGYLLLSLGAIYSRWLFYLLFVVAGGFMVTMFMGFMI